MGDHARGATVTAAPGLGGRRQALTHAAAAALTLFVPFLGVQSTPTAVQQVQIAIGLVGVLATWILPNFTFRGGGYVKALATFATAFGTALVPYLDGGWVELRGTTALIVAVHVLAALLGVIAPNEAAPVPARQTADGAHVITTAPGSPGDPVERETQPPADDEALPFSQPTT